MKRYWVVMLSKAEQTRERVLAGTPQEAAEKWVRRQEGWADTDGQDHVDVRCPATGEAYTLWVAVKIRRVATIQCSRMTRLPPEA